MAVLRTIALPFVLTWSIAAFSGAAHAQSMADHLACYKVKDSIAKRTYTADVDGVVAHAGCFVKMPAKLACLPSTKSNVDPLPPAGGGTGATNGFLCYALKCPKGTLPPVDLADQFGGRVLELKGVKMLCAPVGTAVSTTTTVTTPTTTTTVCNCPAPDGCHLDGICDPTTGGCAYAHAPNGTACEPPNASGTCSNGACEIGACDSTWFDVNARAADGCECQDATPAAGTCLGRANLGTVNLGSVIQFTGKLVPAGRETWLQVTFPSHGTPQRIQFTTNPGAELRFDVYQQCAGGPVFCSDANPASNRQSCDLDSGGVYLVRVYRPTPPVTCDQYTLRVQN